MTGEPSAPDARQVFTVGHSNHGEQEFVGLLRQHQIDVVADVRSHPYANYATHFNAAAIKLLLARAGIQYVFLGEELGGRPADPECYDAEGYVLYDRVAASPRFLQGIQRLEAGIDRYRVAVMCSEEDPAECHRNLLIGRVLSGRGALLWHIRADGRLQSQVELDGESAQDDPRQQVLFDMVKQKLWRSVRSVLPKPPPPDAGD